MNLESLINSLSSDEPPPDLSVHLRSLWYDAKGDWERSHTIIQEINDRNAAWIHAYLHRKEGDIGNADYWYHRAGKSRPSLTLQEEWKEIVKAIVGSSELGASLESLVDGLCQSLYETFSFVVLLCRLWRLDSC